MRHWKHLALKALVIALAGFWTGAFTNAFAQDEEELERLIQGGAQEEEELERLETEVQGVGDGDGILGKVRLPRGEDTPTMLITQDRPIDPDHYVVGPSDVLQLYIWGEFDISYKLLVDPEGAVSTEGPPSQTLPRGSQGLCPSRLVLQDVVRRA